MTFDEIADRVWVARYPEHDVNVSLVAGERGLVVVDTHASAEAARGVIDDIRALGVGKVTAVVNTHDHFDHHLGNGEFRVAYGEIPVHAHEDAAPRIDTADHPFSSAVALDLGDRLVELVHPGRGHTAGDLVVRVQDADVLLAGDLVEESGPPAFGDDCFPFDWPLSVDLALGLVTPHTVVVPGHGAPVGREFVEEQRNEIGIVAETIRDLATRGVPVDQALPQAHWPFPQERLADAVRRGYEQLPRSQKRLPLV